METKENLHAGHRARLTQKFLNNPSSFCEHELLEMLLFNFVPRVNTNDIAHNLLRAFGSLDSVLKASPKDLVKVKGVGEKTASNIALIGKIIEKTSMINQKKKSLSSITFQNVQYVIEYFKTNGTEGLLVLCLDESFRILNELYYNNGLIHAVSADFAELATAFSVNKPKMVLIAHTHPSGEVKPSITDDRSTAKIHMLCSAYGATLIDHLVIHKDKWFSYAREGRLQHIKETCKFENIDF